MKRACLVILVGLIIVCISVPVIARPMDRHGRGAGRMYGGFGEARGGPAMKTGCVVGRILKLKEELGLSDSQVEQLEALKGEIKEQMKTSREAVKAKREALQEAIKAGAEESAVRAAADELGKALGDQAVLRVSTKAKIDGILTEDQKSKLKELKGRRAKGKSKAGEFAKGRKGPGMKAGDPEAVFAKIDSDGDGTISLEEFKAHGEQMKERFAGRGPMRPGSPMGMGGPMGAKGHWGRRPNCPMKQSPNCPMNQPED